MGFFADHIKVYDWNAFSLLWHTVFLDWLALLRSQWESAIHCVTLRSWLFSELNWSDPIRLYFTRDDNWNDAHSDKWTLDKVINGICFTVFARYSISTPLDLKPATDSFHCDLNKQLPIEYNGNEVPTMELVFWVIYSVAKALQFVSIRFDFDLFCSNSTESQFSCFCAAFGWFPVRSCVNLGYVTTECLTASRLNYICDILGLNGSDRWYCDQWSESSRNHFPLIRSHYDRKLLPHTRREIFDLGRVIDQYPRITVPCFRSDLLIPTKYCLWACGWNFRIRFLRDITIRQTWTESTRFW